MAQKRSKILDAVHEAARGLHQAGVVDDVTMRDFDVMCLPPLPKLDAEKLGRSGSKTMSPKASLRPISVSLKAR